MDLTNEELIATKRLNGTETKIIFNASAILDKLHETENWLDTKKTELDDSQYNYLKGKASVLNAILEGDLSKI